MLSACSRVDTQRQGGAPASKVAKKSIVKDEVHQQLTNTSSYFPTDTIYPTRILTEGIFHANEVEVKDGKRQWIGLFKTDSNYYLAPFKISLARVKDDIVDDENKDEKTGWEVKTGVKDSSILLIDALTNLEARAVTPLVKPWTEISDKKIRFTVNGIDYIIYASGDKKKLTVSEEYRFANYKVFIEATVKGQIYKQLLASDDEPEYNITILFAGDIDGDNIPDLIINTSGRENVGQPTLYLSKPATKGQLLKIMGLHTVVGC